MMNNKRDHFIEFLYHNYNNIKNQIIPVFALTISLIGAHSKYKPYILTGFIVAGVFIVIYSFLTWYNKVYSINKDLIVYSDGVIKKRRNDIPIKNIRSINTTDSLIKRMMGISNLKIELIGGGDISFVQSNKQINELKRSIFIGFTDKNQSVKPSKFSFIEYLLLTSSNMRLFLTALSVSLSMGGFAINHFSVELGLATEKQVEKQTQDTRGMLTKINEQDWSKVSWGADNELGQLVGIIVGLSLIITFTLVFLTYRNFSIKSSHTDIEITFGLLTKKHFHIAHEHVRSIRIVEPLLYRIFGYVQIKADNIGLNSSASKTLYIMPIVKKDLVPSILQSHIPMFKQQQANMKPALDVLPNFMIKNTWQIVVSFIALAVITKYSLYGLLLVPLGALFGYLKWKHNGLAFNNEFVTISYASGFKKLTLIILKEYVETTGVSQSFLQNKKKKANYEFAVYSESLIERYKCSLLNESQRNEFLAYIVKK